MKTYSLLGYLIVTLIITIIFGVIYATVQQTYRTGADDPQIQIANDIKTKLQQSKPVANFFNGTINILQSLSSFITLYDIEGNPLRSSGFLDGKPPELPSGIFDFTKSHDEHRVTWQPRNGVRMAMVVVTSNSSPVAFIASGRSLNEVEVREHNLITILFFGWIICIGLILVHAVLQFYYKQNL